MTEFFLNFYNILNDFCTPPVDVAQWSIWTQHNGHEKLKELQSCVICEADFASY